MAATKRLKSLLSILKDNALLFKAIVSTNSKSSSIQIAVLRSTTYNPSITPSETNLATVLSAGNGSLAGASSTIEALMRRLHSTTNAFVALKCLFAFNHIISNGSYILIDQFSCYPSSGGRNFLNFSTFRDCSNTTSYQASSWVRWVAGVLEHNLTTSRVLGYYFCSSSCNFDKKKEGNKVSGLSNSDLLNDLDAIVGFVKRIGDTPDCLYLQSNDLVFKIVRSVGKDYRCAQSEILARVVELGDRVAGLSSDELNRFSTALKRLEDCREGLLRLFVNRMRNDGLWELINQTKVNVVMMKKAKETILVLSSARKNESESTRCLEWERFDDFGPLVPCGSGGGRMDMNPGSLTV